MGFVSSVLPTVQTSGTSPQLSAGQSTGGATALHNGARADPVAAYTPRPVQPATGLAEAVGYITEESHQIEAARNRAEAAQRAYLITSLMAGRNPLSDPLSPGVG